MISLIVNKISYNAVIILICILCQLVNSIDVPVTILIDNTIKNAEAIFEQAKDEVLANAPNVSLFSTIRVSPGCDSKESDGDESLNFFRDHFQSSYSISIGPTCSKNFERFANLTAKFQLLQMNVFMGYPFDHPTMIDIVTRSPTNLIENIFAISKGFDWTQIGVMFCEKCYQDDALASENYFYTILETIQRQNIELKALVKLDQNEDVQAITKKTVVFNTTARVILMFLGNNIDDYSNGLSALNLNNFSREEFTPVIIITKYTPTGIKFPGNVGIFDKTVLIYNNYYGNSLASNFFSKYTFDSHEEAVISLQIYESIYVLSQYLYIANFNLNQSIYVRPEQTISTMNIQGPFGPIAINTNGERVAPFDIVLIDSANTGFMSIGAVEIDKECPTLKCLRFIPNVTNYQPLKDVPLCGFTGENCDQTKIMYAMIFLLGVLAIFGIVYCCCRKYMSSGKGRSIRSPYVIPYEDVKFINFTANDSTHASRNSLRRDSNERAQSRHSMHEENKEIQGRMGSTTQFLATVDQTYVIACKYLTREKIRFDRTDSNDLYQIKQNIQHDNLNSFIGISFDRPSTHMYIIWTQCFRGSLYEYVFNQEKKRGEMRFHGAFVRDILKGLDYLHNSTIGYHGSLSLNNCYIDSHWVVKLTGFGITRLLIKWKSAGQMVTTKNQPVIPISELHYYDKEMRSTMKAMAQNGNKNDATELTQESGRKNDMYAFGHVLYEILYELKSNDLEDDPHPTVCYLFDEEAEQKIPVYPSFPTRDDIHPDIVSLLHRCFGERKSRPDPALCRKICDTVLKMSGSLVDHMMKGLYEYARGLTNQIELRTSDLRREQQESDNLLAELLPPSIAEDLKNGVAIRTKTYSSCTILYSDIVGFTSLCSESQPMEVVTLLSGMYIRFDLIISQQKGYKMETIGDAYCVAAGLPEPSEIEHVKNIAMIALLQRDCLHQFEIPHRKGQYLNCRWGFNTGSVFAGVVGTRAPRYACFGNAVTLASKMESNGIPDRIQMTINSQKLLDQHFSHFIIQARGNWKIEELGNFLTFWLEGSREKEEMRNYLSLINAELEKIQKNNNIHEPIMDKQTAARIKVMADRAAREAAEAAEAATNKSDDLKKLVIIGKDDSSEDSEQNVTPSPNQSMAPADEKEVSQASTVELN